MARQILIVDDNPINRLMLRNTLCAEYDILEAADGQEALDVMQGARETLLVVLLDIHMPGMDGYEVMRRARDSVEISDIPIIVVTGSEDETARTKALSCGANDFITKPCSPDIIVHCVKNNIALYETAVKLNAVRKDKLTGLYNREAFFEIATEMIARKEPGYYLLSCFDIDNFKLINDQYGTAEGDRILREIGKTVLEDMAAYEGVGGRISGDNFAVLMPARHKEISIMRFIRQDRKAFSAKQAVVLSVGRYLIYDTSLTADAIYDRAYIAKQTVKGRYDVHMAYFTDAMLEALVRNQRMIADVDAAIERREFEVWYQPQRNHVTGALTGAEALVRWRHPEKGLIPPNHFIPLFEQNGFIYELDKYVWEEASAHLRRQIDEGRSPVPVSVNVSRQDIFRPGFVDTLSGLIRKYKLPVKLLRLEITESAFAHSTKQIVDIVSELVAFGFVIEIDDFGSGYSSLNTLKSVPAQIVKLDMRFLEDDNDVERGGNILSSIVRMTKWLGMSVIAEGVEDVAQADYLASIGCSNIQGYLYSKPLPAAAYERYCDELEKEHSLPTMNAVENLDNNSFWNPKSMDTLIFSSYVGGACIFEYHNGQLELLRANRKFAAILGDGALSVEDTLKLDWIACLEPESRALVREVLGRSAQTRDEYTNEYVFANIPGLPGKTYLRGTLRVIAATGGRYLVYCTSENITAQREAEENEKLAVQNMEQLLSQMQAMMDDMPGAFVRMRLAPDGALRPFYHNEGFAKLTGMSHAEVREAFATDILSAVHPDDRAAVKAAVARMLITSGAETVRYRLRHKANDYIWVTTIGRIATGADGEKVLNAYFADATEQVREEELQKSLMDNMPCGAGIYEFKDGQMSLTYQNKVYWELVGLNEEAYPDPSSMSAVHPDDLPVVMRELGSAIEQHRDVVCDIRLRHLTLGYRPVHLMGRVVFLETGGFLIYATFTPNDQETVSYQQVLPLLLSAMMKSSTELFFAKDRELRYLCASQAFAEMAGCGDVAEIVGKTDADLFDAEKAAKFRRDDELLLAGGESITDMVEAIPSPDGAPRYASTSKFVLLDGEGEQIGIFGVGHDMTEAKTTASRLEMLTNSIPGGIASYAGWPEDLSTVKMTYFSDGLSRLFGYDREEYAALMDKDPFCLIFEEDLPELLKRIGVLFETGRTADSIFRAHIKGGGYKWINGKAALGEAESGKLAFNAVFFDVTEEREAVEKLRVSEEVNRLAIQQSAGIVCKYDVASRRLSVPENANVIFGADFIEDDIPYKPVRAGRVSPATADAYIAFYESILRGETRGVARFQRVTAQGWRWFEAHFTTIFARGGEPVTAVISMYDITEDMEKDAAYRKWKQSIQDKDPNAYSLYRCNVTKSLMLEASEGLLLPGSAQSDGETNIIKRSALYADEHVAAEDRQRFLSFMNRDAMLLRYGQGRRSDSIEYREKTPDGGYRWIRLSVDFVDSPYSTELEAFLLFENVDKAKRAELAIIERAEKDPLTGALNRSNFITSVEQRFAKRGRHVQSALFIIDLDGFKQVNDFFGHAVGDETLIEISQKLRDTFKGDDLVCRLGGDEFMVYMGGVAHTSVVVERAALVCALLHKSFSLDVQLSASIGISLYPEHGGDFETLYRKADAALYNVKAVGKDGYALYDETMVERQLSSATVAIEKATPTGGVYEKLKRRMLIVDDNEVSRDYLSGLFEDEYLVDTAAEGTAALIRLSRYGSGVSVVLLDLLMPGLDGFAVLKKMRESVAMQHIPVIVVSGMDEREHCLEAIKAGASDYIVKPVDPDLLKLRVSSAISKAENEQLRAQNRYLALQNEEAKRLADARRHSEELSVALHAAEKADLAKSQFLSSMSHEIRTPLNAVIGYNSIARSEMNGAKTDEERKQVSMKVLDCLTKSEIASRHLLTIINDVLDMSAIESGKLKVDDSPFDFRSLISSLTVLFFSQAKAKGVDFEVSFSKPTEEWFVGDQLRINQVLTNLLANAVKFTPEGGRVTLTITEYATDERTTGFRFVVADTGIGMTPDYLEHIWTPFMQAEASISRRFGGSGLGLSITKNLVDLMGGAISVESKSGVGSTFTVDLRLTRTEQPQKLASRGFENVYALVVDDDESTCDYIKRLFDRCGAACKTVTSGRKAIDAFTAAKSAGKPFTLCLVDWRMPQMDGFATISEIRKIAGQDLPVVVVTAYDFNEVAEYAERLGISKFISKPLFQSSLFDLLATVCGQERAPSAAKASKYDFGGARVLLVEDNNMNMEVAKHILQSAQIAVDCAWNGQEAYDIFAASKPGAYKAVLMDVHMPVVNGYEATRMIRGANHPDAKRIPIIAMTADVFAQDIEEAHSAGMNDHIAKPINIEALLTMLASYMEDKKA